MDEVEPSPAQLWQEQQAVDVVQAWCAARERRDLDLLGALCTDDVDLSIDGSVVARGSEELVALFADDLARRPFAMLFPVAGRVRAVGAHELVVELSVLATLTEQELEGGARARWWSDRRRVVLRGSGDTWRICSVELAPGVDADYDTGWGAAVGSTV
jgi:ketosteroid isomerase-like protein